MDSEKTPFAKPDDEELGQPTELVRAPGSRSLDSADSATWLRSVVDALPAIVAYVAADQSYRFVSRNYQRWFGEDADTLVGRKLNDIAPTFEGKGIVRSDDITKDARYGLNAPHKGMPESHLPVRSYLAVPVVARSG
jgi:PAS domain-containing protein